MHSSYLFILILLAYLPAQALNLDELVANGHLKQAVQQGAEQLKNDPHNIALLKKIIKWAGWSSDTTTRIKHMKILADHEPMNVNLHFDLAQNLQWDNQHKEASFYYQKLLQINPHHEKGLKNLGLAYISLQEIDKFILISEEYLKIKPNDIEFLYLQAQHCHWGLCWMKSAKNYNKILEREPAHTNALKYSKLLKKEKAAQFKSQYNFYTDSTNVNKHTASTHYDRALTSRFRLHLDYKYEQGYENVGDYNNHKAYASGAWKHANTTTSKAQAGINRVESTPLYGYILQTSFLQNNYVNLSYVHDSYLSSYSSYKSNITTDTLKASLYSQNFKENIISAEIAYIKYSDENTNQYGYLNWQYNYLRKKITAYSILSLTQQKFNKIYSNSKPYYTDISDPIVHYGTGVVWIKNDQLELDTKIRLTHRNSEPINIQPDIYFSYTFKNKSLLSFRYSTSGSEVFNYDNFNLQYTYLFM